MAKNTFKFNHPSCLSSIVKLERGIHLIIWLKVVLPAKQLIKLKIIKSKKLKHLIATMIISSTLTNKS